jgi:hypothetical protein
MLNYYFESKEVQSLEVLETRNSMTHVIHKKKSFIHVIVQHTILLIVFGKV